MANKPKSLDNHAVRDFLDGYSCAADLVEDHPRTDDIFVGVLGAKTRGDTSTRTLSRQTLFHVLQQCPTIDVASVNEATFRRYGDSTVWRYAATARVASKALARFIAKLPIAFGAPGVRKSRDELDTPYLDDLRACAGPDDQFSNLK